MPMPRTDKNTMYVAKLEAKLWEYIDTNRGSYSINIMSGECVVSVSLMGEGDYEVSSTLKEIALECALDHFNIGY